MCPGNGIDWRGMSQTPFTFAGQIWRPPGPLESYRKPICGAASSSAFWPSRHGARPPTSSFL